MANRMYYDKYESKYISVEERKSEKYGYAPPERFIEVIKGNSIYEEIYSNEKGKKLTIAYTNNDVLYCLVNRKREEISKDNDFDLNNALLETWVIPRDNFEDYVQYYQIK